MLDENIIDQLRQIVSDTLPDGDDRRVVLWHDAKGSFSDDFDALDNSTLGIDHARPIVFARAEDGAMFELKRRILREEPSSDFIVYTRKPRDFSEGGLAGNWLADIEICADHFQADKASLLLDGLKATSEAAPAIEAYELFFNAEGRREQYLRRMPASSSRSDVHCGVMATLLKSPDATYGSIISTYLCAMASGVDKELREQLVKFGAIGAFTALLDACIGYRDDLDDKLSLAAHLLVSAASCTVSVEVFEGLESRISKAHAQFCYGMVRDWMNGAADRDALFVLARLVEEELNLGKRFMGADIGGIVDCDVFPCVNEAILVQTMGALSKGEDAGAEAIKTAQRRKDLKWYKRVESWFEASTAAAGLELFRRSHANGFHEVKAATAWKKYCEDWSEADALYRRFCIAYDRCQHSAEDLPDELRDALEALAEREEGVYANWFLPQVNACWVNCCEQSWQEKGYAEGVGRQRTFYDDFVAKNPDGAKRTLVIVSDALRYEVAKEIATRMEREAKGLVELHAVQSVFPSVTEFGMSALLPHSELQLEWESGRVLADGMDTAGTEGRRKVLRARRPSSTAILSDTLLAGNRAARRETVGDAEVVYVYHDKIDSTGEKAKLERGVFRACDETIDDVLALARIAVNDLHISRVIVTADHGFLYTRKALDEQDKLGKADIGSNDIRLHRRYAISDKPFENDLLIRIDMDDVGGGTYYGFAPRECIRIKRPGGTESYVHGGVSLQEVCVPVVVLRNKRIGSKGYASQQAAEVAVVSTSRSINSTMFHVDLFQREAVGGKVVPAEYELVFTDSSGNPITDLQKVHADMSTADERARVFRPMFTLKSGIDYKRDADYYLVCRDHASGKIVWKETYQVDMAFAPTVDFGF
ncbi:BREX-1 system phosphatase PglZ type A [Slackia heliotrinireducens]|uniref:BREX-1 system phosphatase PglZ type A n=1 Tax=Slackia heliotrinireducens TaxID=84110 RepID=UPI0033163125